MRFRSARSLGFSALLLLALLTDGASAQTFVDLEGSWIARVAKADKGALQLEFGIPEAGVFTVAGRGFTLGGGEFFVVAADQTLRRGPLRHIRGELALVTDTDPPVPIGVLTIEDGKTSKKFDRFSLRGRLAFDGLPAADVKIKGTRPDASEPVLSGGTTGAKVTGRGIRSEAYDLEVLPDPTGFPVFLYTGVGPLEVDGVDVQDDASVGGRFILDEKQRLYGTFLAPAIGAGVANGKLAIKSRKSGGALPRLKLKAVAEPGARKVRVNAGLERNVVPEIGVTPPGPVSLGAVELGGSQDQVFTVRNNGAGLLIGEARFTDESDAAFSLVDLEGAGVSAVAYSVEADQSTSVRVRFTPTESGERTATLSFTGGGGATRVLNAAGADLAVIPLDALEFPDTEVGMTTDASFTIANVGSQPIDGAATLAVGAPDFTFRVGGEDVTTFAYSLDSGETETLTVRFQPTAAGDFDGSVTFSGGSGATRLLSGTAVEAP